jgi:hypothetical protein
VSDRPEFGSASATKPFAADRDRSAPEIVTLNKIGDCDTLIRAAGYFESMMLFTGDFNRACAKVTADHPDEKHKAGVQRNVRP